MKEDLKNHITDASLGITSTHTETGKIAHKEIEVQKVTKKWNLKKIQTNKHKQQTNTKRKPNQPTNQTRKDSQKKIHKQKKHQTNKTQKKTPKPPQNRTKTIKNCKETNMD